MLNNRTITFDCRDVETMTVEERDDYFIGFCGMTYDEFCEYYKDDSPEILDKEFSEFIKNHAIC